MGRLRVVGLSGNVKTPSRTSALVGSILRAVDDRIEAAVQHIDLADAAPVIFRALRADQLDAAGRAIVRAVEEADLLVVGSPVYRASYTGALKHLFDLVHFEALAGKPVILAATGGSPLHGLMIDHQLRPLFAFFKALPLPIGVYAVESDFEDHAVSSAEIRARIDSAANQILTLFSVDATSGRDLSPVASGVASTARRGEAA
jgi:FMN reductase